MCGIAGFVQRSSPADPSALLERMTLACAHRGPDGSGHWHTDHARWSIALGHRRLAIIDLEGGRQPMANEDGQLTIVFNGEIYNHQRLHDRLVAQGHSFHTRSDTEAIVHHVEQHGPQGLGDLDGMFAFALADRRGTQPQLLLARDRVGIKPLFYCSLPDGGLAFASELTSLLAHPAVSRTIDPDALAGYFFLDYVHAPLAMLAGVKKLPPGCFLRWKDGVLEGPTPFWSLAHLDASPAQRERTRVLAALSSDQLRDRTARVLEQSVTDQLLADVPVGVFLSGGIDSSTVAALARRHVTGKLATFTIRFEDPRFDESAFARTVANHLGTDHVEEPLTEAALLDTVQAALDCLDEPNADPSIVPTFALSRLAARHVKVALGGDGGDELFAGYPTCKAHRLARLYALCPGPLRRALVEPMVRALPVSHGYQSFEWKAKRFALRWADQPRPRHLRWMSNLDLPDLARALPGFAAGPVPRAFAGALALPPAPSAHGPGADVLNDILRLDFSTYLPGSVLMKVDRASMANGLEVRPPLLGNDVVDHAFALPSHRKMLGMRTKALLKDVAEGLLPREVVHRRKKGFAIPLASWLRGPLRERIEDALRPGQELWHSGLLSRDAFVRYNDEHQAMRVDRGRTLWALIVLAHWHRRVLASTLPVRSTPVTESKPPQRASAGA